MQEPLVHGSHRNKAPETPQGSLYQGVDLTHKWVRIQQIEFLGWIILDGRNCGSSRIF